MDDEEVSRLPRENASAVEIENQDSGRWRQYYTSLALCALCLSRGFTFGWISPMIQILESDHSPVGRMNEDQINYLQTIPTFAALFGMIETVYIYNKLGTKICCYVQAAIVTAGWLFLLFATSPPLVYAGRSLTMIAGLDTVSGFYLSEIAQDSRRGGLYSLTSFAINFGALIAYFLGVFCDYWNFNLICTIPGCLFPLLIFWVPESPAQLVRFNRINEAVASFAWFRGVTEETAQRAVDEMKILNSDNTSVAMLFKVRSQRKALLIMTFFFGFTQLSGSGVIFAYISKIFEEARCTIAPNESALMIAVVSFVSSLIGSFLIDRAGRRFLTIFSLSLMSLSLYFITAYFIIEQGKWNSIRSNEWLIYVGLGGVAASSVMGIWLTGGTIGSELVPAGVKGNLWMISNTVSTVISLFTLQLYEIITNNYPYYVNFLQDAIFATISIVIGWCIVPETKGKSLAEITAELEGNDRSSPSDRDSEDVADVSQNADDTAQLLNA